QGAAGALLVPGSLALITANFSGREQGRAFGTWAGASGATTILGPLIGGLLVDTISWRAAFFLNVPLVAVAAWATWKHVPESRDEQASSQFDWTGAAIVALAVGGLAFGTIYGQQRAWHDALGFVILGVGVVATVALPLAQLHGHQHLDARDLWRALRDLLLRRPVPAGDARLRRGGGRRGGDSRLALPDLPLAPVRKPVREIRRAPVHDRRPGDHGARRALVRARSGHQHAVEAGPEQSGLVPSSAGVLHRFPARIDHLRVRPLSPGRAADDRAHDIGAGAVRGARVGDQQRDLARRSAAGGGADLRFPHREFLFPAGGARHRHRRHFGEFSQTGQPLEQADRSQPRGCGARRLDELVPPRDGHRRGAASRGCHRQLGRHPEQRRPAAGRRGRGEGARLGDAGVTSTMDSWPS
ncbi:MAG: MFS transporter, partial [Chloroflexi bacterium]